MLIIKSPEELNDLTTKKNDLIIPEKDVKIEFEPTRNEIRHIFCQCLFLMRGNEKYNFNGKNLYVQDFEGKDFNGKDFVGGNFNGENFNGENFSGGNFRGKNWKGTNFDGGSFDGENWDGLNFTGWSFKGKNILYSFFFNCCYSIECESIKARRKLHAKPVSLINKILVKNK